jgi:HK97 family phage portal protein
MALQRFPRFAPFHFRKRKADNRMIGLLKKILRPWLVRESVVRPPVLGLGYRRDVNLQSETAFKKVALVYRCVRAIATNIQQVPVYGVRVVGGRGKNRVDRLPDKHPFAQLLERPNEEDDFSALMEASVTHQYLRGEMLWELDAGKAGDRLLPPARIYGVPPQWIQEVGFDWATRKYTVFKVAVGGTTFPIPAQSAVFFKFYNPENPIRGLAPLSAAYTAADLSHSANLFNTKRFENGGAVSLVYGFDANSPLTELTTDMRERMQAELRKMSNPDGWHTVMITGPGEKIYDPAGGGRRDMDFPELLKRSDSEIRAAMGVPPLLCGDVDNANRANSVEQRGMFWEETLIPVGQDYESLINLRIAPRFGADIRCVFDYSQVPALRKDLQKLSVALVPFVEKNILTVNEARADLDKPPVEWGDDRWDAGHNTAPAEPAMPGEPPPVNAGVLTPDAAKRMVREWKNAVLSRVHAGAKNPLDCFPPAREARKACKKFGVPREFAWQLARQVGIEMAIRWNVTCPADGIEELFAQYERGIDDLVKGETSDRPASGGKEGGE